MIRDQMKPIFSALLAVLGFAVAGCGSGKKTYSGQYTVTLQKECCLRADQG